MKTRNIALGVILLGVISGVGPARAQFVLERSTVTGSGGRSAGDDYAVRSTLAQHDAGEVEGGGYQLSGGFAEGDPYECDPPAPSTNCAATDTLCDGVWVTWDDNSFDEAGFKVIRDGYCLYITGPDETAYCDDEGIAGVTYMYEVVAASACGDAPASNPDPGRRPTSPVAPDSLTVMDLEVVGDSLLVALTWIDRSADEQFQVIYSAGGSAFEAIDTVAANVEGCWQMVPTTGASEYCFAVSAYNCATHARGDTACCTIEASGIGALPDLPSVFAVTVLSPNPTGGEVRIAFDAPSASAPKIVVYDIRGRTVATALSAAVPAGRHTVIWNGRNTQGHRVASGVYFLQVKAPGLKKTKRLVLVR